MQASEKKKKKRRRRRGQRITQVSPLKQVRFEGAEAVELCHEIDHFMRRLQDLAQKRKVWKDAYLKERTNSWTPPVKHQKKARSRHSSQPASTHQLSGRKSQTPSTHVCAGPNPSRWIHSEFPEHTVNDVFRATRYCSTIRNHVHCSAATRIQSTWRLFAAQKRLQLQKLEMMVYTRRRQTAAAVLQNELRKLSTSAQKRQLHRGSTVRIQSAWRIAVAKEKLEQRKLRQSSALVICGFFRRLRAKKTSQIRRLALAKLQTFLRRVRWKTVQFRAACMIQQAMKVNVFVRTRERAARKIQTLHALFVATRQLSRFRLERHALLRDAVANMVKDAAILWSHQVLRHSLVRWITQWRFRRSKTAATFIQVQARRYIATAQVRLHRQVLSSLTAMSYVNLSQVNQFVADQVQTILASALTLCLRDRAALVVCRTCRSYAQTRKRAREVEMVDSSARKIQTMIRGHLHTRHCAATHIQAECRRFLALSQLASISCVSKFCKSSSFLEAGSLPLLPVQTFFSSDASSLSPTTKVDISVHWAASAITLFMREVVTERRNRAALSIQGAWRHALAGRKRAKLKGISDQKFTRSIVSLQGAWRRCLAKRLLESKQVSERAAKELAARRIQKCIRLYNYRKKSIKVIQSFVSTQANRRKKAKDSAAWRIQKAFRQSRHHRAVNVDLSSQSSSLHSRQMLLESTTTHKTPEAVPPLELSKLAFTPLQQGKWVKFQDNQSGRFYWYNSNTSKSSWTRPFGWDDAKALPMATSNYHEAAQEQPSLIGNQTLQRNNWHKFQDEESGAPYWWNEVTGKSSWTKPPGWTDEELRTPMKHQLTQLQPMHQDGSDSEDSYRISNYALALN